MDFSKMNLYIEDLYRTRSLLSKQELIAKTELKEFTPVIDDEVARLLQLLIQIKQPENILEIGTSVGYSAISMALKANLYGGTITAVEWDKTVAAQASENFLRAGVGDSIELVVGDAMEVVPALEKRFDLIFLDVDKHLYPVLFDPCLDRMNTGGLFVAEDVLFPVIDLEEKWYPLIEPIQTFNRMAVESPRIESTILPIGDGVMVAVKK